MHATMLLRRAARWARMVAAGCADLLYPPTCAGCGVGLSVNGGGATAALPICATCWPRLPVVGANVCMRCGMPQGPHVGAVERCAVCPSELGGVIETVALGRYVRLASDQHPATPPHAPDAETGNDASDGANADPQDHPSEAREPVANEPALVHASDGTEPSDERTSDPDLLREIILRLKYRGGLDAARLLGGLLAGEVATRPWIDLVDWVVPVPLHWRRQLERRYNQADLIATVLARRLGLHKQSVLVRNRHTDSQTLLPRHSRASNVEDAFALAPSWRRWLLASGTLEGRNVLLVDDLLTTGATMRNCARVLRQAGVTHVYAAVAARA